MINDQNFEIPINYGFLSFCCTFSIEICEQIPKQSNKLQIQIVTFLPLEIGIVNISGTRTLKVLGFNYNKRILIKIIVTIKQKKHVNIILCSEY